MTKKERKKQMMHKMKRKRWTAFFLAVLMIAAVLPDNFLLAIGVRAEETEPDKSDESGNTVLADSDTLDDENEPVYQAKSKTNWEFTEGESDDTGENWVNITAFKGEKEILLNDYISGNNLSISCELADNKLLEQGVMIAETNKLILPAYFIGQIPVKYTISEEGYEEDTGILNFNVQCGQIEADNFLDTDIVYSNEKGYRAEIEYNENEVVYVIPKENETSDTVFPDSHSKNVFVVFEGENKGYIKIEGEEDYLFYDVYIIDSNENILKSSLKLTADIKGPTAQCSIHIFESEASDSSQEYKAYELISLPLKLATSLNNKQSSFVLEEVQDNLAGIDGIYYYISNEKIADEKIANLSEDEWKSGFDNYKNNRFDYSIESPSGTYYMYYKLIDKVGNISYYNGLGFKLDIDEPVLQFSYNNKEESEEPVIINEDIIVTVKIEEENFKKDDNGNITGITVEIDDSELQEGVSIQSDENGGSAEVEFQLTGEPDAEQTYKIKITCEDAVGKTVSEERTITIDKKAPVLSRSYKNNIEPKISDDNMQIYTFKEDVSAEFTIQENYFDDSKVMIKIAKNNQAEQEIDSNSGYGTVLWDNVQNQNEYSCTLNFTTAAGDADEYKITILCTDKAGNEKEYTETIIIDKKAPVLTVEYKDKNGFQTIDGLKYYKGMAALISVEEAHSLNLDKFENAIRNGIEVKDSNLNEISDAYILTRGENNTYEILFEKDGNYSLNISYTDDCDNVSDTYSEEFGIDRTPPTAGFRLETYIYSQKLPQLENPYYADKLENSLFVGKSDTYFGIAEGASSSNYPSSFILNNIKDNLSGIKTVEYYLSNKPLEEGTDFSSSEIQWEDAYVKSGEDTFTVVLPKGEATDYYIYYKLTDKLDNISYYNGAGIVLDQESPVIAFEYQNTEGNTILAKVEEEVDKIKVSTFSDNIKIKFTIDEVNFDDKNTKVEIKNYDFIKGEYQPVDILQEIEWEYSSADHKAVATTDIFLDKENDVRKCCITVTTRDKAGREAEYTEIINIDKQEPDIHVEYAEKSEERVEAHYFKSTRTAVITLEKIFDSSIDAEDFREAIIKGIHVKNEKYNEINRAETITADITAEQEVKSGDNTLYKISGWDSEHKAFTVTFLADAIYEMDIIYKDKAGNSNSEVTYNSGIEDGASFVIDRQAPKITVVYDNTNMVEEAYYTEKREAAVLVEDLSFTYAYHCENDLTKLENRIVFDIGIINPFINEALPELEVSQWKFYNNAGVFQKDISYHSNAIYTFDMKTKTDICGNSLLSENISYTNTAGEKVNDGTSFVIDSKAPVITVSYDDTNKKDSDFLNGYYHGERKATISIQDLSLYYTKAVRKEEPIIDDSAITWNIRIENEKNEELENNPDNLFYKGDSNWRFDEADSLFKYDICYQKDGIYTFEITLAQDICQNKSNDEDIIYRADDGEFFVIDTAAPIVTVTYDDTNKLENHYYKEKRTATVTLTDLSLTYAKKEGKNKESIEDVLTYKEKVNWDVTAKDAKDENVHNAYATSGKWEYDENSGSYTQIISFSGEAIYEFALSGSDLCENKIEEITYKADDANFFVIDKTAPQIQIIYHDSAANKQTDSYYKDTRTAEITVEDLSYVYEEKLSESEKLTPENRISDWIKITAEDARKNPVLNAFTNEDWSFDLSSGIYKKIICFEEDAIYSFSILENGEIPADIYGNKAEIVYKNSFDNKETEVKDYASFVISRKAPDVRVIYDDNAENKQENHYYKAARTATVNVSDLSFVYEDSQKEAADSSLAADKLLIQITAENEKKDRLENSYHMEGWNFDKENGIYTQKITYTDDAIYSWSISGKNIYGQDIQTVYRDEQNQEVEDYASFVIDRAAPEIIVTYDNKNKSSDYYENYFYQGERTARIEVSDLSYVYEDQQKVAQAQNTPLLTTDNRVQVVITAVNESGALVENAFTKSGWSFDSENGVYINNIIFKEDAIYKYENSAADIYGRTAEFTYTSTDSLSEENIKDWASFVIDTDAPKITVTYDDRNKGTNTTKQEYTNGYYKDNRTANITISDLSFLYADKYMPERIHAEHLILNETDEDTNLYILPKIDAYSNDTETEVQNAHTMNPESLWSWNEAQNGYQASITFMAEANYSFEIEGRDICKNEAGADDISYLDAVDANHFVIDRTAPTISITYDNNVPVRTIDGRGYFARIRTATIVITEGCDTFDREDAFNNITITAKDAAGNDVGAGTYTISGWTESKASENGTATRYTAKITYIGNANYTFSISYMDKTGHTATSINTNSSAAPYTFTVDSSAPTGSVSVSGFGSWSRLTELLTFHRWSNSAVNITASADDGISSVYSVKYYKTAAVTAMTRQQLLDLSDSSWTDYRAFSVRPDEMFSVYIRIEDRSGNITFVSSDGIIVDATAPSEESIAPEITVAPVQPINNIYNTDVTVDITVTDPIVNGSYSGLKSIRYEVQNMGSVTQQGQLYAFNYTAGQTLQSQLLQRWNGQIVVDRNLNNSNDVRIVVYAQDNSDNTSSAYTSVQIDITQPSIEISYDNNNGDASFGTATYFNADRTATIRITERNFNANDVQITITNTDGVIPSVSGWSSLAGTGNGDDAVHTATVTYSADGDYVFAISYADLAGNINTAVQYGNSTAPEQFTIDKTLPVINVAYDNNSVQNDNYYSAVRTATVSITEHNFDAGRYTITLTASDDGVDKSAPSISGWSNNGDIHTASVQFTDDGYYTMNMSYTDMAGNQAAQFVQQTFYVDQTMPRVTVKGIKNNTANNAETIGFEITCTDTNFDVFTPRLTVTKMVNGSNVTEDCTMNQVTTVRNGQTYTVENLNQDGIYSLTCTARDKAGNVFNRVVYLNDADQEESGIDALEGFSFLNFSVNRSGSVYTLESYADEVAKDYYVKEVDEDLVIVETNVDTLDGYIELNGKRLTEGTDYRVEISGGNGEWYVVRYIINKELFASEGEYKIVIYSEDHAGNVAYSDIKGTNFSFVIDKTAPVVTVSGIEDNGRYRVERQTVTVIPKDDGGKLQKITIEAFDQNGNMLDGFPIVYEGEELLALLEENNGELTFELPEGTGMSVRIRCEDAAGNEMEMMSFDNIVVSTNRLTIILADKRFIYGAMAGILLLAVLVVLLIVWKKGRKKESNKVEQA